MSKEIRIKEIRDIDEDKPTMYSEIGYDLYTEAIRGISKAYDAMTGIRTNFNLSAVERVRIDIAITALRQAGDIVGDLDVPF